MTYTPNYTADDLGVIAIDGVGKGLFVAIGFVALFVLGAIFIWVRNALK